MWINYYVAETYSDIVVATVSPAPILTSIVAK